MGAEVLLEVVLDVSGEGFHGIEGFALWVFDDFGNETEVEKFTKNPVDSAITNGGFLKKLRGGGVSGGKDKEKVGVIFGEIERVDNGALSGRHMVIIQYLGVWSKYLFADLTYKICML